MKKIITVFLLSALVACSDTESQSGKTEDEKLYDLVEQHFEDETNLYPNYAVYYGDYRFNHKFANDISDEYLAARHEIDSEYLEKLKQLDYKKLGESQKLTYQMFERNRQMALVSEKFPSYYLPANQFYSYFSDIAGYASAEDAQPFNTVKDYRDFLLRLDEFLVWMSTAKQRMKEGIKVKVTLPRILSERLLSQLEAQLVAEPSNSIFYSAVKKFPETFTDKDKKDLEAEYLEKIQSKILPAYRDFVAFMKKEYVPASRGSDGMSALPNGLDWYQILSNINTTTTMPVDDIHKLGLKEVARIREQMSEVSKKLDFEGDLQQFLTYMSSHPKHFFESEQALIDAYMEVKQVIDKVLPDYFNIQPKTPYEIRPVEAYRAQSAAGASYQSGSPDGSRPGVFYINTYNLKAQPKWGVMTLSLHEAAPGHHFQISIQQELEGLPKFQRFGGYTAYSEGWALYTEQLGVEMGLFTDPYQYFGKLSDEMLRAMRLVVDTGLHAKGWSREQAILYMKNNSAMAETDIVAEVERYMAIPGQALSYKVGQLKILDIRAKAEESLGERFSLQDFHYQVLKDGAVPMNVLEQKIDQWVKAH